MSSDQIPNNRMSDEEARSYFDQLSDEEKQREIEQTETILRRFRHWAKQAPLRDLISLKGASEKSDTSQSNPKT